MKRIIYLIVPLIAISLLSSCGCSKSEPTYTITFKNNGDQDKKIKNIKAGSIITENIPTPTDREGYTFIGWCVDTESKNVFDFNKIKIYEDYTLYSGWKENKPNTYTVTWVNEDGTVLQTDEVEDGNMPPEYQKAIPTKKSDAFNDYEFDGFIPKRSEVHSDQAYVAHYETHTYPNTKVYMSVDIKNDAEHFAFMSEASGNLTVYWGDGKKSEDVSPLVVQHEYKNAGEYSIRVFGGITELELPRRDAAIKDVYLGDTISAIPTQAFFETSLQSISFSEDSQLSTIGGYVFYQCNNLVSITIPSSVTSIGDSAFLECSNLKTVTFEDESKLESFDEGLFWGCSSLTSINIPSGLTEINGSAFRKCTSLTSITIPSSVTSINGPVFWGCSNLQTVDLTSYNTDSTIPTLGENVFSGCPSELKFRVASREMAEKFINSDEGWPTDINKYSWLLEECTWAEINEISKSGRANEFFNIGDTKKVQLKHQDTNKDGTDKITEGELYQTVRIIGFNHDYSELPDDGSNPDPSKVLGITFEFADVITDSSGDASTTKWNSKDGESSTNYDYRQSTINDFLNNDVLNMLPSSGDLDNPDLKEVIKPVDKKVGVSTDSGSTYTATSFDGTTYPYPYLFALAYNEMADSEYYVTEGEGTKYQYYKDHKDAIDRIKRKVDIEGGNGEYYWLRSPRTIGSNYAWLCGSDGGLYSIHVYYGAFAVAPAFCI